VAFRRGREKAFHPVDPPDLLVVGLGNPGAELEGTRHNLGWEVVGILARRGGIALSRSRQRSTVGVGAVDGLRLALACPLTYMNNSGEAVRLLAQRFSLEPRQLLVAYDDIDLAFARIRIKDGGGTGGHQGLNSIVNHLHSKEFVRVKIGVGRPPGRMDPAEYVLRRFSKTEREEIDVVLEEAADAVVSIGRNGVAAAMNAYNGVRPEP